VISLVTSYYDKQGSICVCACVYVSIKIKQLKSKLIFQKLWTTYEDFILIAVGTE